MVHGREKGVLSQRPHLPQYVSVSMRVHLNRGLRHVPDSADEQPFWQLCAPCACHVPPVRLVSSLGAILWALLTVPRLGVMVV